MKPRRNLGDVTPTSVTHSGAESTTRMRLLSGSPLGSRLSSRLGRAGQPLQGIPVTRWGVTRPRDATVRGSVELVVRAGELTPTPGARRARWRTTIHRSPCRPRARATLGSEAVDRSGDERVRSLAPKLEPPVGAEAQQPCRGPTACMGKTGGSVNATRSNGFGGAGPFQCSIAELPTVVVTPAREGTRGRHAAHMKPAPRKEGLQRGWCPRERTPGAALWAER